MIFFIGFSLTLHPGQSASTNDVPADLSPPLQLFAAEVGVPVFIASGYSGPSSFV
ncbi:hypothetical protein [Bradyrhizobium sp. DASA03007]|uniref:hypothetical protein n=1 Tax=unclassified Bradyrhizobium TaxID=2631580 RepID=UPI003F716F43